ncbi:lipid II:glycine glycyltransferase FemX [Blastococcus sp. SYSU DS0973]
MESISMTLTVERISPDEHRGFLAERPASYLQCPGWAAVKNEWGAEHLGWRDEQGRLVGVALVLYRRLPVLRRSLAFVAEGPVVDWAAHPLGDVVDPLTAHVRARGAVTLRMGPDLDLHRWHATTVKAAVGPGRRLCDLAPDVTDPVAEQVAKDLVARDWTRSPEGLGLYGSTLYSFRVELAGRTPAELLAGMNQQWRRSIRKAEKAGVQVELGGAADLGDFHRVYLDTARRDGFLPHPLEHFQRAWNALSAEAPDRVRLYLGRYDGEVLAGMLVVTVAGLAGYAYGGSASHRREVHPSNAVHWRILQDLLAEGTDVYDMRGIDDSLDPEDGKFGVLRFKVGTGGDAVENVGDWDLAVRPVLHWLIQRLLPLWARAGVRVRNALVSLRSRGSESMASGDVGR